MLSIQVAARKGALALAAVVFLLLATGLARTKAPWCDEGSFANPAYNLAFHGQMGSNVMEPTGHVLNAYLSGIKERTYIVVPNHLVALAAWFRIFGFSLFTMRAYSIMWGLVGLLLFFYILTKFFPDPRVAQLGVLFTAIDFVYLWCSADGRMDSSSNALALASVAAYIHFRERNFAKAIFVSQWFGALAVFTHPNSLVVLLAIPVFIWRFDRSQLRFRHLYLATLPYVFFGLLWSFYILQSPADFSAQFWANAAGTGSSRWKMVIRPWQSVGREIIRHLGTYCISGLWGGKASGRSIFIPFFYIAAATSFVWNCKKYSKPVQMFLALLLTTVFAMTFLNGFKASDYMIYLVPLYCATLAFGLLNLSNHGPLGRVLAIALGMGFVFLQLADSIDHIRADDYHRGYLPAIARLQQERLAGNTIVGTSALGFGLGFHGFADDWRLGLYSGLKPQILVLDYSYRDFAKYYTVYEPKVLTHYFSTLTANYRLSKRFDQYWIFERVTEKRPVLDIRRAGLKENDKIAEYLFNELLREGSGSSDGTIANAKFGL